MGLSGLEALFVAEKRVLALRIASRSALCWFGHWAIRDVGFGALGSRAVLYLVPQCFIPFYDKLRVPNVACRCRELRHRNAARFL